MKLLLLLIISTPLFANHEPLKKLASDPSEKAFTAFKSACTKAKSIDFDGNSDDEEFLNKALTTGNPILIRALVYSMGKCTDGASSERLVSFLGNEILLKHPEKLIKALDDEKRTDLYYLPEKENSDWFAVSCEDDECRTDRKKYFAQKRTALKAAQIDKSLGPIRDLLLKNLKSDL